MTNGEWSGTGRRRRVWGVSWDDRTEYRMILNPPPHPNPHPSLQHFTLILTPYIRRSNNIIAIQWYAPASRVRWNNKILRTQPPQPTTKQQRKTHLSLIRAHRLPPLGHVGGDIMPCHERPRSWECAGNHGCFHFCAVCLRRVATVCPTYDLAQRYEPTYLMYLPFYLKYANTPVVYVCSTRNAASQNATNR